MFRPTVPQLSLMETRFLVSPAKRERLERSWAEAFRTRVLPLIDEEAFRDCFCADNGRPNTSIRLLVGLHLLKEADDLTDAQVLDNLEYNIQWQYALGVEPADAHVCQKTLHNFRHLLMQNKRAQGVYQGLVDALMKADGLSAVRQRLDSTHVISNIAVLTRLGLFTETVTHFMRDLRKECPTKLESLDPGYAKRYLDREGYFSDATREQAQRRLPIVAQDLLGLVRAFEADDVVKDWASFRMLVRLLTEQCDVSAPGDGETPAGGAAVPPVTPKAPKEVGSGSLQSPHDPDATYGHKGKGYEAQLTETCAPENPYQLITAVVLTDSNESDAKATVPIIEQLLDRGIAPEVMLADTAYSGGENIAACAALGVELLAPVQDPHAPEPPARWEQPVGAESVVGAVPTDESPAVVLGLGKFRFNAHYNAATACPAGHAPLASGVPDAGDGYESTFDGRKCDTCPLAHRCPTRAEPHTGGDRVLRFRDVKAATAARQAEQRTPAFKQQYRLRSGIESTNAELKGRHGAGDLRVRHRPRVEVAIYLKAAALNVKRAVEHHVAVRRIELNGVPATQV